MIKEKNHATNNKAQINPITNLNHHTITEGMKERHSRSIFPHIYIHIHIHTLKQCFDLDFSSELQSILDSYMIQFWKIHDLYGRIISLMLIYQTFLNNAIKLSNLLKLNKR